MDFKKIILIFNSCLLFTSCVNTDNKASTEDGTQSGNLSYLFQDIPPDSPGGAWKRVWSLTGPYSGDLAIDEMTDKNGDNWQEIARTNRDGVFIQKDVSIEKKYRFDGHLETPWMPALMDTLVTAPVDPDNQFQGRRCVVPTATTLHIGSRRLVFRCKETIIEGTIMAYSGGYSGQSAGSVDIAGEIVSIKGAIHLIGESGYGGERGRDRVPGREGGGSPCSNGGNGTPGGRGGAIYIKALKELHLDESLLNVSGGPGGEGGAGGSGGCRAGAAAPAGGPGFIEITKPLGQEN